MAGGGMGFIFDPARKAEAQEWLATMMRAAKRELESAVPFAMDPVVYEFAINERGTWAELRTGDQALMPAGYYMLTAPALIRHEQRTLSAFRRAELDAFGAAARTQPALAGMVESLFDRLLPPREQADGRQQSLATMLDANGFDRVQHEQIRADLRSGRIGLAQNRLPVRSVIEDVRPGDVLDPARLSAAEQDALRTLGMDALAQLIGGGHGMRPEGIQHLGLAGRGRGLGHLDCRIGRLPHGAVRAGGQRQLRIDPGRVAQAHHLVDVGLGGAKAGLGEKASGLGAGGGLVGGRRGAGGWRGGR